MVIGHTTQIKLWGKNRAQKMPLKRLGIYERDNPPNPSTDAYSGG